MDGSVVITLEKIEDGFYKVRIKPSIGHTYNREFSWLALKEYIEDMENFCYWKGYKFIYLDETK